MTAHMWTAHTMAPLDISKVPWTHLCLHLHYLHSDPSCTHLSSLQVPCNPLPSFHSDNEWWVSEHVCSPLQLVKAHAIQFVTYFYCHPCPQSFCHIIEPEWSLQHKSWLATPLIIMISSGWQHLKLLIYLNIKKRETVTCFLKDAICSSWVFLPKSWNWIWSCLYF